MSLSAFPDEQSSTGASKLLLSFVWKPLRSVIFAPVECCFTTNIGPAFNRKSASLAGNKIKKCMILLLLLGEQQQDAVACCCSKFYAHFNLLLWSGESLLLLLPLQ